MILPGLWVNAGETECREVGVHGRAADKENNLRG